MKIGISYCNNLSLAELLTKIYIIDFENRECQESHRNLLQMNFPMQIASSIAVY